MNGDNILRRYDASGQRKIRFDLILIFGVLTPLSTIFQLYHGDQFLVVEEAGVPGENNRPWASNW